MTISKSLSTEEMFVDRPKAVFSLLKIQVAVRFFNGGFLFVYYLRKDN